MKCHCLFSSTLAFVTYVALVIFLCYFFFVTGDVLLSSPVHLFCVYVKWCGLISCLTTPFYQQVVCCLSLLFVFSVSWCCRIICNFLSWSDVIIFSTHFLLESENSASLSLRWCVGGAQTRARWFPSTSTTWRWGAMMALRNSSLSGPWPLSTSSTKIHPSTTCLPSISWMKSKVLGLHCVCVVHGILS